MALRGTVDRGKTSVHVVRCNGKTVLTVVEPDYWIFNILKVGMFLSNG